MSPRLPASAAEQARADIRAAGSGHPCRENRRRVAVEIVDLDGSD